MSRLISRQQTSFSLASGGDAGGRGGAKGKSKADVEREEKGMEAEAAMSRHIEQCESDYGGVYLGWTSEAAGAEKRR
jgi:hypothetical protein